jgi:hypothetical protein
MKNPYIYLFIGLFLLIDLQLAFGGTPGEVYEKHRSEIMRGEITVFGGNVFFVIHSKVGKRINSNSMFRKMKLRALKNLRPSFSRYKSPGVKKEWFELYYSLPSISNNSIKKSFVVDKNITKDQAYLVLTVPVEEVAFTLINPKIVVDQVNQAFNKGTLTSLAKYSRVVMGDRLKEVKKKIAQRSSVRSRNEKIKDELSENNEPTKYDKQTQKLGLKVDENKNNKILHEQNFDDNLMQEVYERSNSNEESNTEDELKKPIVCDLPLCREINKKNLINDSYEGTNTENKTKESFKGTRIMENNEFDDLL